LSKRPKQGRTRSIDARIRTTARRRLTLVIPDHRPNSLKAILQLTPHSIRDIINTIQQFPLLLQLPAHRIRLLPQIPHRPKHAIKRNILLLQNLLLSLLLKLLIPILSLPLIVAAKRVRIWQSYSWSCTSMSVALPLSALDLPPHPLDLVRNIGDEFLPPADFGHVDAIAVGVAFDGFDAAEEVFEVGGEFGEGGVDLGVGLEEFGRGVRGCGGADAEVGG